MARLYRRRRRIKPPSAKEKEPEKTTGTLKAIGGRPEAERYDPKAYTGTRISDMIPPAPRVAKPQDREEAERQARLESEYFKRGITLFDKGLYEEALKKFAAVLKMTPTDPDVNYNAALCYQFLNKPKTATEALLAVLRERPKWGDAWYVLSGILLRRQMFEEAEEACCYAIKDGCKDEAGAYERLGRVLWAQRRYREAAEVFEACLKQYPENAVGHYFLGQFQYRQAKLDSAKKFLEDAVKHGPKFAEAWNALGRTQCLLGQVFEAKPTFDKALEVNEGNKVAQRWQEFVGKVEKSLVLVLPAIMPEKRAPQTAVEAYVQLGMRFIEARSYEFAVEALELGTQQIPDSAEIELWYGTACALTSQYDIAMDIWQKLYEDAPDNERVVVLLALGCIMTGRKKLAVDLQKKIAGKLSETLGALVEFMPVAYDQPWASKEEAIATAEGDEDEEESSVVFL